MGSLASRPSVLAPQPQVVFVPAPAPAPVPPTPVDSNPPADNPAAGNVPPTEEAQQAEAREGNLLRRSRGRFGTVLTGFRGLLGAASSAPRKTLLGE